MTEKSQVADIDRSIYDIRDAEHDAYRMEAGLTPAIVEKLSKEKNDPAWMEQFRLESLQIYNNMRVPDWGPSLDGLDIDHIATYVRPNTKMQNNWENVPQDIKDTFERLGIPQAERKSLAGVGAQYDSELVYHNVRAEVAAQGVVYTDMESALHGEYAEMVRKYFMKLVTPRDHKFAALHGAVWSGGSFVYVPKGVQVSIPLQSYFRLNAKGAGQFEHTLIIVDEGASLHFIEGCSAPKYNVANLHAGCVELYVKKGAKLRYSTIENWSKNMYNLNTKIVLIVTFLLLVLGTVGIAVFEWNASFAGMSVADKWTQAFFNATCPRTAGFTSVDLAGLGVQTLLIYLFLMWVGGGSQSTAGGIKVNAFAVVVLNLVAVLRGTERVEVFGRELSHDSIRRSNATVVMSFGVLLLFIFIISILEPGTSLLAITFECVSALSTVGSSLNLTPRLGDDSKLLVALLMFVGRVGLITLMLGIIKQKKHTKYQYPSGQIIIN